MSVWRLDLKIQKLWFILMTSSINSSMKVPKKRKLRPIQKWPTKIRIGWFFLHISTKCDTFVGVTFSENYRKVRKLTEGQKWKTQTHPHSFDRNSSFNDSYHSTWTSWDICEFYFVNRLISHVIRSKVFSGIIPL